MIKLGFVGLGRVADVHYESVHRESTRAKVVAVCDVWPEAVAERSANWNATGFISYEKMLKEADRDAFRPSALQGWGTELVAQHFNESFYQGKPQ